MHYRRIGLFATSIALAAISFANYAPDVANISKNNLDAHLRFIASDLLQGRDTPSHGLDTAAAYIAAQLQMYGVEPGGVDGTYFQPMSYTSSTLSTEGTILQIDGKQIELGTGYIPTTVVPADVQGSAIFVKSGWTNVETGVDPMKDMNVKGAIVITDGALPEGMTQQALFRDPKWESPQAAAKRHGAVAVITIAPTVNATLWKRNLERMTAAGRYTLDTGSANQPIPTVQVAPEVGASLISAAINAAGSEFVSPAPNVTLKLNVVQNKTTASNVIGIVPGSDPTLKSEYVAIGSHYDHVGIGRADATGDTIYNGADDDGSGTVAMIEIARVIATGQRPKRTTVFIWHCGEEKGLVGSRYFANNPTINLKNMIIQINIDMIGMAKQPGDTSAENAELTGPDEIYVIGPKLISTDITRTLTAVNNATVKMRLNEKYDTTEDRNQFYRRSDHFSYIEKGVPAIFLFSGVHAHYHQASDEIDKIDFDKLTLTTKLLYGLTYEFANQKDKPRVDGPLKNLFGGQQ